MKIALDSSAIELLRCPMLFKYIVIDGYKPKYTSNDLLWGSAVHDAFFVFYTNWDVNKAIATAIENAQSTIKVPKKPKTPEAIKECLYDFLTNDNFKPHIWKNVQLVESYWCKQVYTDYINDDKIDFILCGTVDAIGSLPGIGTVIKDVKTTSLRDENIIYDIYRNSLQMLIYSRYASEFYGYNRLPVVIDAIMPTGKVKAKRLLPPIQFDMHLYDLIEDNIRNLCIYISNMIKSFFPMNLSQCKKPYQSVCPFIDVCRSPDIIRQDILLRDFIQSDYNPKMFGSNSGGKDLTEIKSLKPNCNEIDTF